MGTEVDGSDSRALQIASETHWPQMRVLILVVSASRWSVEKNSFAHILDVFKWVFCIKYIYQVG